MTEQMGSIIATWYKNWFRTDRLYGEWGKKRGLTYTSLFSLYVLHSTGGCTPQAISEFLSLSKQTINSALSRFDKEGWIRREPSSTDGRSCTVYLSETGQAFADQLMGEMAGMERRAFGRLSEAEIGQVVALNGRLADFLQEEMREDRTHG